MKSSWLKVSSGKSTVVEEEETNSPIESISPLLVKRDGQSQGPIELFGLAIIRCLNCDSGQKKKPLSMSA